MFVVGFLSLACTDVGDFPAVSIGGESGGRRGIEDAGVDGSLEDGAALAATRDAHAEDVARILYDPDSGTAGYRVVAADLRARSGTCARCAEASCPSVVRACGELPGGAVDGPAKGTRKALLCAETVECLTRRACSLRSALYCYCGTQVAENCLGTDTADGPCKPELERSLETTSSVEIPLRFDDPTLAGGWAMAVVQCLRDNACTSCFQSGDEDAQVGEGT